MASSYPTHSMNNMLPSFLKSSLLSDGDRSLKSIREAVERIEKFQGDVFDPKLLPLLSRLISDHISLKYPFDVSLKSYAATVLMNVFRTKQLSIASKTKILNMIIYLIGKKHEYVPFEMPWKPIWEESLAYIMREKKHEAKAGDEILSKYIFKLTEFMAVGRRYVNREDGSIEDIIQLSLDRLVDLRSSVCAEGVLLLICCLPTDFKDYDMYLPKWLSIWTATEHNFYWDVCWLTLFTRARKFSKTFDWSQIHGMLLVKIRQFLGINSAKESSSSSFPKLIPIYYTFYFGREFHEKKVGLNKLAKLLYFVTMLPNQPASKSEQLIRGDPITATPVEIRSENYGIESSRKYPGYNSSELVKPRAIDLCLFFQTLRSFFYPSNNGNWTQYLACFLSTFIDELCTHVGYSLANKIFSDSNKQTDCDSKKVFGNAIHIPTIQYIIGCSLSLIIEGLYGKSSSMLQSASSCVKNIITLDPSYVDIFLPLFLSALDSSAVTQSHQALAALQASIFCFKRFLFPKPVILNYLPQLLRLALPGIDAADHAKTLITLKFFSTVFCWIPIRSRYVSFVHDQASFLDLVDINNPEIKSTVHIDTEHILSLDILSSMWSEWLPMFWDRIALVLNILEPKNNGNKNQLSMLAGSISECCSNISRCLLRSNMNFPVDESDLQLRYNFEEKIFEYVMKTSAYNTAKTLAKILRILGTNPDSLSKILNLLVDSDVLNLTCSNEKLAFRLFLIGGVCRSAGNGLLSVLDDKLMPIIRNEKFFQHTEKDIRKAYTKLVKNVLRGLTATFVVNIPVTYETSHSDDKEKGFIFGSPNPIGSGVIEWFHPTQETILKAIDILKLTVSKPMETVRSILSTCTDKNAITDSEQIQPFKKIEESLIFNIKLIQKALRGAAEVLGDDMSVVESMDQTNEEDNYQSNEVYFPATGRDELINRLPDEADRNYLITLRRQVSEWLLFIYSIIRPSKSTQLNPSYVGLKNSTTFIKGWFKTFIILVVNRMSHIKNVDQYRKGMDYATVIQTSSFVQSIQKYIRYNFPDIDETSTLLFHDEPLSKLVTLSQSILSKEYWIGHDLPTSYIAQNVTIHYILRIYAYGVATIRKLSNHTIQGKCFLECLYALAEFTSHEYDDVRHEAIGAFERLSHRFGSKLNGVIHDVLGGIRNGGIIKRRDDVEAIMDTNDTNMSKEFEYASLAGGFSILRQSRILSRINSDRNLVQKFLETIIIAPEIISHVSDAEKRSRLDRHYLDAFTKYISHWNYLPRLPNQIQSENELFTKCLQRLFGFYGASDGPSVSNIVGSSLKHDTVLSFIVLHYIGNPEVTITRNVWKWAIDTISNSSGQPVQLVASATLVRLFHLVYWNHIPSDGLLEIISSISWPKFLHGISQCHPREVDGQNSWTNAILDAAFNNSCIISRRVYCDTIEDSRNSMPKYQKRFSTLFLSLFTIISQSISIEDTVIPLFVTQAVDAAKNLVSTNDVEERADSATKSELFMGIYTAFYHKKYLGFVHRQLWQQIETLLIDFLSESTQSLSVSSVYDWTDAIYFAFYQIPISWSHESRYQTYLTNLKVHGTQNAVLESSDLKLVDCIIENFLIAVSGGETIVGSTASTGTGEGEGYSRHQRSILFARALLSGDITSGILSTVPIPGYPPEALIESRQRGSVIVKLLYDILSDSSLSNLLSPFYYIRVEIATLLSCINCFVPKCQSIDISIIVDRLLSSTVSTTQASSSIAASAVTMDDIEEPTIASITAMIAPSKYRSEVAMFWLKGFIEYLLHEETCTYSSTVLNILPKLLSLAIEGSGHSDLEFAKTAHSCVVQTALSLDRSCRSYSGSQSSNGIIGNDIIGQYLQTLGKYSSHDSWHIRETVGVALNIYMTTNWTVLSSGERKFCKDIIVELQFDMKPEVQSIAVLGMISYLTNKSATELNTLANAYIKNCETLAVRESKKRKAQRDTDERLDSGLLTPSSDRSYWSNIAMAVSLIRTFPYDLPPFMPNLVAALIKHLNFVKDKSFIAKTIQDFKRSHQDKWTQFSTAFTREQLDDLQGTGAAHYFA